MLISEQSQRNLGKVASKFEGYDSIALLSYKGNRGGGPPPGPPSPYGRGNSISKKYGLFYDYYK